MSFPEASTELMMSDSANARTGDVCRHASSTPAMTDRAFAFFADPDRSSAYMTMAADIAEAGEAVPT